MTGRFPIVWVFSATTLGGLTSRAHRLYEWVLKHREADPIDIGYSLAAQDSELPWRAVVVGRGRRELIEGLRAAADKSPLSNVVVGFASRTGYRRPAVAFVVPPPDLATVSLGSYLLPELPVFAAAMRRCAHHLAPMVGANLAERLSDARELSTVVTLDMLGPLCSGVHLSVATVWNSYGVQPDLVVSDASGASVAEVIAGRLSVVEIANEVGVRPPAGTGVSLAEILCRESFRDVGIFIEMGLSPLLEELRRSDAIATLGSGEPAWVVIPPSDDVAAAGLSFVRAVALAYVSGARVSWSAGFAGRYALLLDLPV